MEDLLPRLYIIMREDIPDMNPGKGMAQAAHAQADFDDYLADNRGPNYTQEDPFWMTVSTWMEGRSFGTTLVLSATLAAMKEINEEIPRSGMTVDPTYPWRNHYGKLFLTKETTCMWAFAHTADEIEFMKQFPLHK